MPRTDAMHSFRYISGSLHCEDVSLDTLAKEHGTPLYVYSAGTFRDHFSKLDKALSDLPHEVAYAVKANSNLSVLRLLAELGSGFDIVSGGELLRVIKAGGDPAKCTFACLYTHLRAHETLLELACPLLHEKKKYTVYTIKQKKSTTYINK